MTTPEALRIKYSDPVDPWEMLDTPWGHMPAWKAATYATGTTEAAMRAYEQVRNDSASIVARHDAREAELNARADAIAGRERKHAVHVAKFVDFVGQASVLFDRLHQLKADAEEEPLPLPPGDPSDPSKDPEPNLELEDDAGELPDPDPGSPHIPGEFPRLNRPIQRDQDEPPAGGVEFPTEPLPHPPTVPPPIAAGLDKE